MKDILHTDQSKLNPEHCFQKQIATKPENFETSTGNKGFVLISRDYCTVLLYKKEQGGRSNITALRLQRVSITIYETYKKIFVKCKIALCCKLYSDVTRIKYTITVNWHTLASNRRSSSLAQTPAWST